MFRSAAGAGVKVRLQAAQRQSWTISSFLRRVPRRVRLWPPQKGQASGCLLVSGTRAMRGIGGDIKIGLDMVTVSCTSRKSNGEHTRIGAWRIHRFWSTGWARGAQLRGFLRGCLLASPRRWYRWRRRRCWRRCRRQTCFSLGDARATGAMARASHALGPSREPLHGELRSPLTGLSRRRFWDEYKRSYGADGRLSLGQGSDVRQPEPGARLCRP